MASQEETAMMRTQYPDSDCLFLQGCGNLHKDTPLAAASRWTGGDPAISVEFKSDMFWKHITACKLRDRFDTGELHKVQQSKLTLLWQQLVSFIQIQCNWLHPGGTPGSNILIKLICEILTMWVFRWLVIWCERSLCFHWRDTRGAGTCFGKTLQKIIAVELSWVQAITNDSVCLSPRETRFLHQLFFFFLLAFGDGLSKYSSPRLRLLSAICYGWFTTLINLIMMSQRKGKRSALL